MSIDHQSQGETARSPSDNKKFFARWTNERAFARSRTNEQTFFHSYEDERTSRRANYDVFVDRDCQPTFVLCTCFALGVAASLVEDRNRARPPLGAAGDDDQGESRNWQGQREKRKGRRSHFRRQEKQGQTRSEDDHHLCSKGREEYQGEKKVRKNEKSGRRGGRKTTGLENSFIISHYSLRLPSQELLELLLCLDQVRVLEFGNRVVVDLGFQRHSLFLYYFWGESLSLSLSLSLSRWIVVVSFSFPPWFHFPYPFSMCQGFCFNFSSSVFLFLSCGLHAFVGF